MRPLAHGVTEYRKGDALPGYVLFSPANGRNSYLLDETGAIVHQWQLPGKLGNYAQFLDNGNILVTCQTPDAPKLSARGGRILELDKDSSIVWEFTDRFQHHDLNPTASGNVLYLAWDLIPSEDAKRVKGGLPDSDHDDGGVYEDVLREVDRDGNQVWEWRMQDHFPYDKYPLRDHHNRHEFAHANACHVQADGNILVSFRSLSLIILVNRETGNIDWEMQDWKWGGQHDPHRLDNGNILIFANGSEQTTPEYSRILEIDPDSREIVWMYKGDPTSTFFSARISAAERLPNGNTFIDEGLHGRLFEVTPGGGIVWEYVSPFYFADPQMGHSNRIFRARKYAKDDPRLKEILG